MCILRSRQRGATRMPLSERWTVWIVICHIGEFTNISVIHVMYKGSSQFDIINHNITSCKEQLLSFKYVMRWTRCKMTFLLLFVAMYKGTRIIHQGKRHCLFWIAMDSVIVAWHVSWSPRYCQTILRPHPQW